MVRDAKAHWTLGLLVSALACSPLETKDVQVQSGAATAPIVFVQGNFAVPQSPTATVTVRFNAAQGAGDLNVVAVGWNDTTAQVTSVTDTRGNSYQLAVGPTQRAGVCSQSIYYAKGIAAAGAGANTVSVTFSAAAVFPDIRVAEYSGIDPLTPLDVTAAATGTNSASNSGAVTTTNANDLLVGANIVATGTTAAGASFTGRMITDPDGDILEDRVVTATGSFSAGAPLSSAGAWVMQMAAFRAAVLSSDTQAPTAPTNLTATPASMSQINLAWTASTDDVGVTSYLIERCQGAGCSNFAQVGTSASTTFSSTGLALQTSYSFRVRATDAAGNLSAFSGTAGATTLGDTQAPTAPSGLTATAISASQINLTWTASTDNVGVTSYLVERCQGAGCSNFAQVGTSASTTFSSTGLALQTSYSFRVRATDAAGNLSAFSGTAGATTLGDTQAPTAPSGLTATAISASQNNLAWTASTDNVGVTSYLVERCQGAGCSNFAQVGTSASTTFSSTGLAAQTSYSFRVRATDAAANLSGFSSTASATTQSAPVVPPTPAFVQGSYAVPQSPQSTVTVTYTGAQAAGDLNVVIVGWNDPVSTVTSVTDGAGNSYIRAVGPTAVTGVATQSIYYAKNIVTAAAGNVVTVRFNQAAAFADIRILEYRNIDAANPVDATAAGTGTNATSSSGALTTTNATDLLVAGNVVASGTTGAGSGFTSRMITNPDGDIAEDRVVTATGSYTGTAPLSSGGGWVMQMVAFRAPAPADTQAPTAPSNLTATTASISQINLTWTASTDNVGVTSYLVERCQGAGCSTFAQVGTSTTTSFSSTGLSAQTSYSFRVRATDAAGNPSAFSNVATATTLGDLAAPCTGGSQCGSGFCVDGVCCNTACAGNQCTACNVPGSVGTCSPKPSGTTCTDGNACTQTDTCQAGTCTGANPIVCTAQDQCHAAGACDSATGVCSNPPRSDGTTCNDGNACTLADTCQAGACVGASPVACSPQDQCHVAGVCNPATGVCSNPVAVDDTVCTDNNGCTTADRCRAGVCVSASTIQCGTLDQCHLEGTCNPATGICAYPPVPDGTACNDGDVCTTADSCQAGACVASTPDTDHDGIPDCTDNCPSVANPGQENSDSIPAGDACQVQARPTTFAAGQSHVCAIRDGGRVLCWGANFVGQLGTGDTLDAPTPVTVSGLSDAVSIATSPVGTCAVRATGEMACWGANAPSQGGSVDPTLPSAIQGIANAVKAAAGLDHTCALLATGDVVCWGLGSNGELGNGSTADSATPVTVQGLIGAVDVSSRSSTNCAVRSTGEVRCWGRGFDGQLGNGSTADSSVPVPVSGISDAVTVAVGGAHACALHATGGVSCWGYGAFGQLGSGGTADSNVPVSVSGLADAIAIAASNIGTCALRGTGEVVCWGDNSVGQLGTGPTSTPTPVAIAGISDATAVAAGSSHTCATRAAGDVRCLGDNSYGQLGDGTTQSSLTPVTVNFQPVVARPATVAGGNLHTCAIRDGGQVFCWGYQFTGQLGEVDPSNSPVAIAGLTDAVSLSASFIDTCAVRATGEAACWMGLLPPVPVPGLADAVALASNAGQTCFLRATGQVACWGGDPSTMPVNVVGLSDATAVAAGATHACALRANGQVVCWGQGDAGQLGIGASTFTPTPVAVLGLDDAAAITSHESANHTCALRRTGEAVCWGAAFANGTGSDANTPVKVQGVSSGTSIAAGGGHTCVLRTTGEIRCWGNNGFGQLGTESDPFPFWAARAVPGLTDATTLGLGYLHTCAARASGDVACWGWNTAGQIGCGTANSSMPRSVFNPDPLLCP